MVTKGTILELETDSAAFEGHSVARSNGLVVFVRNAVPGDRVRARIVKSRKKYAEAVVEELLESSPYRVDPRCKYFGVCGGCKWQHMEYEQQLLFKQRQVSEILEHIGGFDSVSVEPTLPAPHIYDYRSKMEFSFGTNRWLTAAEIASGDELEKGFALGLHIPKRYDKILDLDECHLQSSLSVKIVNKVREVAMAEGWRAYNSNTREGYLRNLVIRTGFFTAESMIYLVTLHNRPDRMKQLTEAILGEIPEVTTVINAINDTLSPVAYGSEEIVYHGPGTIRERIGDLEFCISPTTFFQPNSSQAFHLFQVVREYAQLSGREVVYDLYSGIGTIALLLAPDCRKVVGIDSHEQAVEGARANAAANGIENCSFFSLDAAKSLTRNFALRRGRPEVLVVDPPRVGMHKDVCHAILMMAPERIVYVSCNPATQARDLTVLGSSYEVEKVQPVDMFPQTYHIENVVALKRRSHVRPASL